MFIGLSLVAVGTALMLWVGSLSFGRDLWLFALAGAVALVAGAVTLVFRIMSNRRAAAVITAVMVAGALAVGTSTAILGRDAHEAALTVGTPDQVIVNGLRYEEGQSTSTVWDPATDVVTAVKRALPGSLDAVRSRATVRAAPGSRARFHGVEIRVPDRVPWGSPSSSGHGSEFSYFVWVDGAGLLEAIGAPDGARRALAGADAVVFAPAVAKTPLAGTVLADRVERAKVSIAVVQSERRDLWGTVVLDPAKATPWGLQSFPADIVVRAPRPLTADQRRALDGISPVSQGPGSTRRLVFLHFARPQPSSLGTCLQVLGGALVFCLGIVAVGLRTSRVRGRRLRSVRALTIAGAGGLLAVPVGFGPAAAYLAGPGERPVLFPTGAALAVAVLIPAAVTLVVAGASRRKPEPVP